MESAKIENFIGKKITVWLLGQSQLNISPGLVTHGTLIGIDQGLYIVKREDDSGNATGETVMIPMGQCRVSFTDRNEKG